MALKLYPIGIQTFEEIVNRQLLYIDKTAYIYRMAHSGGKHFFLSRPRRFGKSLLVTTLQSYFEGKKDLFKGLAIEQLEQEWTEYPVLHFDLSGGKHMDKEQLEEYLGYRLQEEERKWGITEPAKGANNRLIDLINTAYEKTGRQVVVLIDEYDAPLLDVVHEETQLPVLRNVMRNFYSPLKYSEAKLRFVFLTGITKFSQLSIFSELNNIKNISMDEPYAGICGITEDEMLTQMSDDIDLLADKQKLSREETIGKLKAKYDGYHFTWPSPDVYNPFSLLNCFADGKMNAYWFGSGTPTYLLSMMRKYDFLPTNLGEDAWVEAADFDAATETMTTIMPLLYQSGYLTIKDYDPESELYLLSLPNNEIRTGLFRSLMPHYLGRNSADGNTATARMAVQIRRGNIDEGLQLMADFLETVPYCDNTHYEGHWQQTLYIIFALLSGYSIQVEQHTAKGRIDITLETQSTIYVMELKINGSVEEAFAQIESRHYADAFKMKNKPVVKVGMNFSLKDGVNRLEWETK